jgi:hypothetical protein
MGQTDPCGTLIPFSQSNAITCDHVVQTGGTIHIVRCHGAIPMHRHGPRPSRSGGRGFRHPRDDSAVLYPGPGYARRPMPADDQPLPGQAKQMIHVAVPPT